MGRDRRYRGGCCDRGDAADATIGGSAGGVGAGDRRVHLRLSMGVTEAARSWCKEITFVDKMLHLSR